jgi:hypothetical protein
LSDATEQRAAASVPDEKAAPLPPPAVVAPPAKARPFPPLTCALCAVCALLYLAISLSGTSSWEEVARWGYLPAERIWAGAYWALVTSAFVHVELSLRVDGHEVHSTDGNGDRDFLHAASVAAGQQRGLTPLF